VVIYFVVDVAVVVVFGSTTLLTHLQKPTTNSPEALGFVDNCRRQHSHEASCNSAPAIQLQLQSFHTERRQSNGETGAVRFSSRFWDQGCRCFERRFGAGTSLKLVSFLVCATTHSRTSSRNT